MALSNTHRSFSADYNPTDPTRTIWALPSNVCSLTDFRTEDQFHQPDTLVGSLRHPVIGHKDIFRSPQGAPKAPRASGIIGEGRRANNSNYNNAHVQQLLRTLNLNSPAPIDGHKQTNSTLSIDTSPSSLHLSCTSTLPSSLSLSSASTSPISPYFSSASVSSTSQTSTNLLSPIQDHSPSSCTSQFFYPSQPLPPHCGHLPPLDWRCDPQNWAQTQRQFPPRPSDWHLAANKKQSLDHTSNVSQENPLRYPIGSHPESSASNRHCRQNLNYIHLLHPSSSPPYRVLVEWVVESYDEQASVFLQQKIKTAHANERAKIVNAMCHRAYDIMCHRVGNWAVQRCIEAASSEEIFTLFSCVKGRFILIAKNVYGCHVLQKALDCEEGIRRVIVSEFLADDDPCQTIVNKHAFHVWSKILELSWTSPAPPILPYITKALKGKWASIARHEMGSIVVQIAFENLDDEIHDTIVDELLNRGFSVFKEVTKSWGGSFCIQHILERGSDAHKHMAVCHLLQGLYEFTLHENGVKSVKKALKCGGFDVVDKIIRRVCEPTNEYIQIILPFTK